MNRKNRCLVLVASSGLLLAAIVAPVAYGQSSAPKGKAASEKSQADLASLPAAPPDTTLIGANAPGSERLKLDHVVLFSSGVGFFEHRGQVEGDTTVDLRFNVRDINDLLKSMVLEDLGGGRISTVTYGSKDPITKTLQTFAIDLTSNPSLGDILNQVRGENVELRALSHVRGVILGVETRKKPGGGESKEPVEVQYLNVLGDDGILSIPLESIGRIKLFDPKLDAELRHALKVLAMGHATDKKTVSLKFDGTGARPVRVGYVQETPIWKTSYRLVLKDGAAPFLQGWAIVENTTEVDWKDVSLTLISGRPISYSMNLYDPLYVRRPVVEPELFASLRPQTYGQDLARSASPAAPASSAEAAMDERGSGDVNSWAALNRSEKRGGAKSRALYATNGASRELAYTITKPVYEGMRPDAGVQSVAQAANVGELFQYAIATPVSLPRQQSAMLPIVNESVKGRKLSIYNPAVHAKHPLNGMELENSTDLHLMQGPITVFDGGAYAGDARIEDLAPGGKRLISYAMDLDTEVETQAQGHPEQVLSVKINKGVMLVTQKYRRTQQYTAKNSGKKAKNLLIEYPHDTNWNLVTPKEPAEKPRGLYRFAVALEPGKPAKLEVEEERLVHQQLALTNLDDNTIVYFSKQKTASDEVKQALQQVIERKRKIARVTTQRQQNTQQIAQIEQDQSRVRENMRVLERNSDLYRRYVKEFAGQEDRIEAFRAENTKLTAEETRLREDLDKYLETLTI